MDEYILDENGNPKKVYDLDEWGKWFDKNKKHISDTTIDNVRISTVFLGLDHSFDGGKPVLFETMIFGGKHDLYTERCHTKEEAIEMHERAVSLVRGKR